ncbi:hypothetical protein E1B28_007616 [Marasmius oreades]|uniref:HIT-type domain-containing protein n=1 Tax=Marasmius oreades TaxID=181124 RepID=A0A9P7S1Z7_9AGAR|nr:uncharacterized protein E1B28_007616 [Marasmius oreades]KAG7093986.1 hypothetical protein E1B28_007616 [Marasmius oreades]
MNVNGDSQSNVVCKICRRQLSRYTCPKCNVPYCSLTCFRSSVHSDCSETFYKKEIKDGIAGQPAGNAEERLKMMEILKRFEESNLDDEGPDGSDEDDLGDRFEGLNLENAAYEDIWGRLTEEEKNRFLKAVDNPESDLRRDLLTHSQEECEPWWEGHLTDDHEEPERRMPEPMEIPSAMVRATSLPTGPPLIYNLCAICIAYAYATRRFVTSLLSNAPEKDVREMISKLVPFLAERKSTTLHTNLNSLIVDMWSRFDQDTTSNSTLCILLGDVAQLMRTRPPIALVPNSTSVEPGHVDYGSHPNRYLALVLSDLYHIYRGTKHIAHKLVFYAAHVLSTPPAVLHSLATDLEDRSKEHGKKGNELHDFCATETNRKRASKVEGVALDLEQQKKLPLVVEL